jgi:hypothetical protein
MPVLDRLVRPFFKEKKKYEYELVFDDEKREYQLTLLYIVPKNFFLQSLYAVQGKIGKHIRALDSFAVPARFFGSFGNTVDNALKQIVEQVKKDKEMKQPGFKPLSRQINSITFLRKEKNYVAKVEVSGFFR